MAANVTAIGPFVQSPAGGFDAQRASSDPNSCLTVYRCRVMTFACRKSGPAVPVMQSAQKMAGAKCARQPAGRASL
jgi:hypothetical protein